MKRPIVTALTVGILLLLVGVGGPATGCKPPPSPEPSLPPVAVALTVELAIQDRALVVTGLTDLPDGARLAIDIIGAPGSATLSAVVKAGSYRAIKNVSGWSKGTLRATVEFDPSTNYQPGMAELFGVKGTRLTGKNVVSTEGGTKLIVSESAEVALSGSPPADLATEETNAPYTLALKIWGGKPRSDTDSGIVLGGFENGVLAVEYHYYPFGNDALWECQRELSRLFEAEFTQRSGPDKVAVIIDLPFSDAYGKITWSPCVLCSMTRATAAKINWENFDASNLPRVCDEWWDSR